MKTWKKYENFLISGEWHVHTAYTDGHNTVEELCEEAERRGIPLIAFTEHVRRKLNYSFEDLLYDIERAKEEHPSLVILSGVEAKVLPDGSLDVSEDIIREVDYPVFAFHSFPDDLATYVDALHAVINGGKAHTWAHPGVFLIKHNFDPYSIPVEKIIRLLKENDILLEINGKYNLPFKQWIAIACKYNVKFVCGSDIHRISEFDRRTNICGNAAKLCNMSKNTIK